MSKSILFLPILNGLFLMGCVSKNDCGCGLKNISMIPNYSA